MLMMMALTDDAVAEQAHMLDASEEIRALNAHVIIAKTQLSLLIEERKKLRDKDLNVDQATIQKQRSDAYHELITSV